MASSSSLFFCFSNFWGVLVDLYFGQSIRLKGNDLGFVLSLVPYNFQFCSYIFFSFSEWELYPKYGCGPPIDGPLARAIDSLSLALLHQTFADRPICFLCATQKNKNKIYFIQRKAKVGILVAPFFRFRQFLIGHKTTCVILPVHLSYYLGSFILSWFKLEEFFSLSNDILYIGSCNVF